MADVKKIVGHQVRRTFGVVSTLAVIGIVGFVAWSIWVTIFKPHLNPTKTTSQQAAQINNPTYAPAPRFGGCANMRVQEYYKD